MKRLKRRRWSYYLYTAHLRARQSLQKHASNKVLCAAFAPKKTFLTSMMDYTNEQADICYASLVYQMNVNNYVRPR